MTLTLPLKPLVFGTPTAPHQGLGEMVSSLVGSEILRIARDELGMVESKPPELVTPAVETVGAVDPAAAPGSSSTSESTDGASAADG